jgi:hypothetical protein
MAYMEIYRVHQSVYKRKSECHSYIVTRKLYVQLRPTGHFPGDVLGVFNGGDIFFYLQLHSNICNLKLYIQNITF